MDRIQRDIYFLRDWVKYPIDYPQGADEIPLEFIARDYELPSGAAIRVCVEKPSGKTIYNELVGAIDGNTIIIQPEKQMTAEAGRTDLQIEIKKDESTLLSFVYPINIKRILLNIVCHNAINLIALFLKDVLYAIVTLVSTTTSLIIYSSH